MKPKLPSQKELLNIRAKIYWNKATKQEATTFIEYVKVLEELLDEADLEDFFGTEGWMKHVRLESK